MDEEVKNCEEGECKETATTWCDNCGKPLCDKHMYESQGQVLCIDCFAEQTVEMATRG